MNGWAGGVAYGIAAPPFWAAFWWVILDRRTGRSFFLFRWVFIGCVAGCLQMVPDPVTGHTVWAQIGRALLGQPDAHIAIGNAVSAVVGILVWLWYRRRDKVRAYLRSLRARERAIIAAMVKTMKERQRVPARTPLPQPG